MMLYKKRCKNFLKETSKILLKSPQVRKWLYPQAHMSTSPQVDKPTSPFAHISTNGQDHLPASPHVGEWSKPQVRKHVCPQACKSIDMNLNEMIRLLMV